MKTGVKGACVFVLGMAMATGMALAQDGSANRASLPPGPGSESPLAREVHHQLVLLPYYNVFDNLAFRVEGSAVTLIGQVVNPITKDDAARAVRGIEGVTHVNNQIEVLPVSPMDAQIRRAEFRAVYSSPGFEKYAIQAVPPIHIIVKNGNVTLVGVVQNQMDKTLAGTRANTVPNVFHVTNDLQVENR